MQPGDAVTPGEIESCAACVETARRWRQAGRETPFAVLRVVHAVLCRATPPIPHERRVGEGRCGQ